MNNSVVYVFAAFAHSHPNRKNVLRNYNYKRLFTRRTLASMIAPGDKVYRTNLWFFFFFWAFARSLQFIRLLRNQAEKAFRNYNGTFTYKYVQSNPKRIIAFTTPVTVKTPKNDRLGKRAGATVVEIIRFSVTIPIIAPVSETFRVSFRISSNTFTNYLRYHMTDERTVYVVRKLCYGFCFVTIRVACAITRVQNIKRRRLTTNGRLSFLVNVNN